MRIIIILILLTSLIFPCYSADNDMEKKIGQMIMIGFNGTSFNSESFDPLRSYIKNGEIGGIVFLAGNVTGKYQVKQFISNIKKIRTETPLFIGVDQEGGNVARLNAKKGFRYFPSAKKTADTKNLNQAYGSYLQMAKTVKGAGFNLNFAPVVDLNINPESPAIGHYWRSYSADPKIVTKYAEQLIKSHRKVGLLTSLKHYPGHGSAKEDSHFSFVDVTNTWNKNELIPYQDLIKKGLVDMIITAHIYNANVDKVYPASLSKEHIQNNLRNKMGYDGVVITDDLQMGAIKDQYEIKAAIIAAVNAGSDILFFVDPVELPPKKVRNIILQAIKDGKIKKERINESYNRIMKLKKRLT